MFREGEVMRNNRVHREVDCNKRHNCCLSNFSATETELQELERMGLDPGEYSQMDEQMRATFQHHLRVIGTGSQNPTYYSIAL